MYPEATLQDIYKGCFQDRFGPAHILTNRDAAKNYILREVSSADSFGSPDYEPCGHRGGYYRVNLRLVADGIISADELTDALMQSAQGVDSAMISGWRREWHEIQHVVETMHNGRRISQKILQRLPNCLIAANMLCTIAKRLTRITIHTIA